MNRSELYARQEERFPVAAASAERKILTVRPSQFVAGLVRAAQRSRRPMQRVRWLHQAASKWAEAIEPVAACRKGCAHCCHLPTLIFSSEARLLARESGREAVSPDPRHSVVVRDLGNLAPGSMVQDGLRRFLGRPCPFLVDGACAVYHARPLVCRTHLNLDDDDLLCRLGPGDAPQVPYADATEIRAVAMVLMQGDTLADIRDFFPSEG